MEKRVVPTAIRTVHEGPVFSVRIESITLPNGGRFDAEIVRHPGSVVIVPVTESGEIVLVRQYRAAIGQLAWELPAGTLKPGEALEAAAARECHEELGLIPGRLERIGSLYPTPGYCDEVMHFFRATLLRAPGPADRPAEPDEDEDIETETLPPATILARIAAGDIVDMKTVAGLALMDGA